MQEREAITNLAALGWSIRRITRELGLSRNTVRNYVRVLREEDAEVLTERIMSSALPSYGSEGAPAQTDPLSTPGSESSPTQTDPLSTPGSTGRKSLCLEHGQWIQGKVEEGLSAQRIYQDLQAEHGFTGSYQSVKRYVHKLRQADPKLVYRIEVAPAEEVQVDFGTGPTLITPEGKRRKTWIFRIVLSHSRKAYSEAVHRQDTETFIRCLENSFRHFGGSTLTINLDNLKAAVLKFDWADPELNPKLLDFARHYRTTILPCLPETPEHKGKVENSVKYVKTNALAGRKFESLAALNQFLARWEKTVADLRIHGTTKCQVAERFAFEKNHLQPLPASLFPFFHEGPRTVHRDGYVEVEKAYYHVPPEYLGYQVWIRYNGREVRIFLQDQQGLLKQIQLHRRLEPGQFTKVRGIGGGQGTLQANLRYWVDRASNLGSSCSLWVQTVAQNRGIEAIRTLMGLVRLVDRYSFAAVNRACERAHARGTWRLRDVRLLLEAKEIQTELSFVEQHPLIRNLSEYQQFIETKTQNL
ncbi:MAG: IS21 family transposase [Planctomycetota bacterium]